MSENNEEELYQEILAIMETGKTKPGEIAKTLNDKGKVRADGKPYHHSNITIILAKYEEKQTEKSERQQKPKEENIMKSIEVALEEALQKVNGIKDKAKQLEERKDIASLFHKAAKEVRGKIDKDITKLNKEKKKLWPMIKLIATAKSDSGKAQVGLQGAGKLILMKPSKKGTYTLNNEIKSYINTNMSDKLNIDEVKEHVISMKQESK
jgi:hypothetical protein